KKHSPWVMQRLDVVLAPCQRLNFVALHPAIDLPHAIESFGKLDQILDAVLGCRTVILSLRIPVALNPELLNSRPKIFGAFKICLKLFAIALDVFDKILLARIVSQIDSESHASA